MPSLAKSKPAPIRVCIIGDSHIAAVKRAVDDGYKPPVDVPVSIDFFGAPGPSFREISLRNDQFVASDTLRGFDDFISTAGHTALNGTEFDAYFFVSARFRSNAIFEAFLPGFAHPDVYVSKAARFSVIRRICQRRTSMRAASAMAAAGARYVALSPTPFMTKDIPALLSYPDGYTAKAAGAAERSMIWSDFERYMEKRGVHLIRQSEETIVDGCLTDPKWAVEGAVEKKDAVHKNPQFAKLLLDHFFLAEGFAALTGAQGTAAAGDQKAA